MKKFFALMLICALLLGVLAGCAEDNSAAEDTTETQSREVPNVALHTPAEAFAGGSGTENDPYLIETAEQLALLRQSMIAEYEADILDRTYADACYRLTADICLNDVSDVTNWAEAAPSYAWEPIGGGKTSFGGIFDGDGHSISGMYLNMDHSDDNESYGLFGKVEGTVKNLTVEDSYLCVSGSTKNVGAIAGNLISEQALIENCTVDATIELYGASKAGGIAGNTYGMIDKCSFGGSITQKDDVWSEVGGIAGNGGNITDCENRGTLRCLNGDVGGIVAYGEIVSDCVNYGTVAAADTAGGITAKLYQIGTGVELTVLEGGVFNCKNEGEVAAATCAGGIVGTVGNDESDYTITLDGCENYGTILCELQAAGIAGKITSERGDIVLRGCINYADITCADKVGGVVCEVLGGILNQKGALTISECVNNGDITTTDGMYSGGIVTYFLLMGAEIDLQLTIEGCENTGSIRSNKNAGGILCFSSTTLSSNEDVSETSAIAIRDCTNSGDILGTSSNSFLGGIAGNFSAEGIATVFERCTNTGNITLELALTEEEIQETLAGPTITLSQILGGIVGRLGEGLLLTTDNDGGNEANINNPNANIIFRDCRNSGELYTPDYSAYTNSNGEAVWVSFIGGIIGNTCAEDAYAFFAENCTFTNTARGLGNTDYPDIGTKQ